MFVPFKGGRGRSGVKGERRDGWVGEGYYWRLLVINGPRSFKENRVSNLLRISLSRPFQSRLSVRLSPVGIWDLSTCFR